MRFWVWSFSGASGRHDHCLTCLGIQHAEEAFVDCSCSSCGDMTISELRNRLRYVKHGGVPLPRSSVRPGTRGGAASGGVRSDFGSSMHLMMILTRPLLRCAFRVFQNRSYSKPRLLFFFFFFIKACLWYFECTQIKVDYLQFRTM